MTVLKLGGSFAHSPHLAAWLDWIAQSAGGIVVVAGGGPFADTVRETQTLIGYDDETAHDMALMAMAQYARMLASLRPSFRYADNIAAIGSAVANSLVPVWSPWPMLRDHADIARSWDVTSDSLAAWLAAEIRSDRLLVAKHRPDFDAAFPDFRARFSGEVEVVGPEPPLDVVRHAA